jgi:hypothetical protein
VAPLETSIARSRDTFHLPAWRRIVKRSRQPIENVDHVIDRMIERASTASKGGLNGSASSSDVARNWGSGTRASDQGAGDQPQ